MNLSQRYVLDWHDEVGKSEPLHTMLREVIKDREANQNAYITLDRDEDSDIFEELDKLVPERPQRVLFLVWW